MFSKAQTEHVQTSKIHLHSIYPECYAYSAGVILVLLMMDRRSPNTQLLGSHNWFRWCWFDLIQDRQVHKTSECCSTVKNSKERPVHVPIVGLQYTIIHF